MKKVIDRGKRIRTLSVVKPVENISKHLQSFMEIGLMQKEVLPSHMLQDHVYDSNFFHKKMTASVTKSSNHGPCYLHLPIFFLYIFSPLLLENKTLLSSLFNYIYY